MEAEHTALPWKLDQYGNVKAGGRDNVLVTGFSLNTGFADKTAEANTAFIVRACNAHDELVKALKHVLADLESHDGNAYCQHGVEQEAIAAARTALAKAGA